MTLTVQDESSKRKATILVVDDEISNIEIMFATLGDYYEISFATSGEQALEIARLALPDLVLLDVVMPGMQGFEVCEILKADPLLSDIPVIFTTGLGDTEDEVRGLSIGAIDYVTKPIEPVILRNRVRNHIELKLLRDRLAEMAVTDALTGLHNRRKLDALLRDGVNSLSATRDWLSVVMLDIDYFKQFNDTYGHQSGDGCLRMVASTLNRAVKTVCGYSARYGGEEFACVLPQSNAEQAIELAKEISHQLLQLHIPHEQSQVSDCVTLSIGIATARCEEGLLPEHWTRVADEQLYAAKLSGRNQLKNRIFSANEILQAEVNSA